MKTIAITAALLAIVACAKSESGQAADTTTAAATPPAPDRATTAANVSNAIAANPAKADSILQANNMTRESFDQTMYDIAADSAMSARYAAAKTR